MTKNVRLLDMAKMTCGQTMTSSDEFAVSMENKYFVKSFDVNLKGEAYCPVIFEKDIVHHIKMLLHGANTEGERAILMYLAYELGLEDEILKEQQHV
jgi:hypothetical protein